MRPEDRERIQVEVVSRVVERCTEEARTSSADHLDLLIQDTLYHERRRLEREPRDHARAELAFYDRIQHRLRHASQADLRDLVTAISRHFVREVVGNFDERVYKLSTRLIPSGLQALLTATSVLRLLSPRDGHGSLAEHLRVEGEIEHARRLLDHGTLMVVPTHLSNLDSVVMGYVAFLIGLPPLCYGAGLNLFTNPLISFFMRNLGAYKVDRKKSCVLYKEVLKEYATCSLEMGYHNLFFPGGTRSRSGAVEQKLKLGLLGTGVRAYARNLQAGKLRPAIYVVPCTISYMLVLEAETLIEDHL
jgi:glycerol-3-phosphate O-acyltransferase